MKIAVRFSNKGRKWHGWDGQRCQEEWDAAVRDTSVKRITNEYGELCIAKLATRVDSSGFRLGNKRSIGETKSFGVGDQEAIADSAAGQEPSLTSQKAAQVS